MLALPWEKMKNLLWRTSQSVPSDTAACQRIRVPFTVLGNGPNRTLQPPPLHQELEQGEQQRLISTEVVVDILHWALLV